VGCHDWLDGCRNHRWEADLAYTPEFFESGDGDVDLIDNSNAVTAMFNAVIGVPVGGQRGGGFRPYISGGAGLLQTNVEDSQSLFTVNNSEFGLNIGAGAYGFVSDHVGIRGDVRYSGRSPIPTRTTNSISDSVTSTSGAARQA
jgi:opacity protein-like surface antigen